MTIMIAVLSYRLKVVTEHPPIQRVMTTTISATQDKVRKTGSLVFTFRQTNFSGINCVIPLRGIRGDRANWHPTCFCSRSCCQPMAMMFLCCTYTNQNTKNLWRPNPSLFENYHDNPFLNHVSVLF